MRAVINAVVRLGGLVPCARFICVGWLAFVGLGFSACRSAQGVGVVQAERIKDRTKDARAIVKKYDIEKEDEEALSQLFDEIDEQAETLGKDRDKEAVKAEDNAIAASKWRFLIGGLIAVAVLIGLWFGRSFIIRILSGGIAK